MKKFVRGRVGRAISSLLMALMLLPALTLPLGSIGQAATGGRQNIIMLPLHSSVGNAPYDLSGRILQQVQIVLAGQLGVQVNELPPNSPLLARAKDQLSDEEKGQLVANYNAAVDPTTDSGTRIAAAGELVKSLGVDAIVYGNIDQYEFTNSPDPRQTLIHVTATKITLEAQKPGTEGKATPIASPIVVIGKSTIRINDKSVQASHDQEAVVNVAHSLANQLTGNIEEPAKQPVIIEKGHSGGKGAGSAILPLLGLALLAAVAGGSGSKGSAASSGNVVTLNPPTNLRVTEEPTTLNSVPTATTGFPKLQWIPSTSTAVQGYEIYRQESTKVWTRASAVNSYVSTNKLRGTTKDSRSTSRVRTVSAMRAGSTRVSSNPIIGTVMGQLANSYVDHTAVDGKNYTYSVVAFSLSGGSTNRSIQSDPADSGLVNTQAPVKIGDDPRTTPLAASVVSGVVKVTWGAPIENLDGSDLLDPGKFEVYRSTTIQSVQNSAPSLTLAQINSASFTRVAEVTWTAGLANFSYDDLTAPPTTNVTYVVVALNAKSHFDMTGTYTGTQLTTGVNDGVILTTDHQQLVVVDENAPNATLDASKPSIATLTATVVKSGQPQAGQFVSFSTSDNDGAFVDNSGAIIIPSVLTDSTGKAVIKYRAGFHVGTKTITATWGLKNSTTNIASVAGLPAAPLIIAAQVTGATATGTVTVNDKNGNPVPGVFVQLLIDRFVITPNFANTDNNGVVSFTINTMGQAGTATVTAQVAAVSPATFPVNFTSLPNPQLISGPTKINVNSTTNTYRWLLRQAGNPLVSTQVRAHVNIGKLVSGSNNGTDIVLTTDTAGQLSYSYTAPAQPTTATFQFFDSNNAQIGIDKSYPVVIPGPTSLTALATSSSAISLNWGAITGATAYTLQRSTDGTTWNNIPATINTNSYIDSGVGNLAAGTLYYYQVSATTNNGQSEMSNIATATTFPDKPVLTVTVKSGTEIDLSWTAVTGAINYRVLRRLSTDPVNNFLQVGVDLPPTTTTYADKSVAPNTTYVYEVVAVGLSATAASDPQMATTFNIIKVNTYNMATSIPRIYYSVDPDDQLADGTAMVTDMTVTGFGANNVLAVGANIKVTADHGSFIARGTDQTVSADKLSITGILDASGKMTFSYSGKPDDGIAKGAITLPNIADLGSPTFTVLNDDIAVTPGAAVVLPTLVGTPFNIRLASSDFSQAGDPPTLFMDKTLTITATVTDLIGQPVLAEMPIWSTQSWSQYQSSAQPPYDYAGAQGAGSVRLPYGRTDANGVVNNIGFHSNYSGLYTVKAFALRKDFDKATLDQVTNLDDPSAYISNLLPSSSIGTTVTSTTSVWVKTFAFYDHWLILNSSSARVNCDGSMTTRVTFRATDENNKPVLPGVQFSVGTGRAKLELDGGVPVLPISVLTFNERSEGYVLVRGKGIIGSVNLVFQNLGRLTQQFFDSPIVTTLYGPGYGEAIFIAEPELTNPLAGSDQMNNVQAHKTVNITVDLEDKAAGNPFPDGYLIELFDNSTNGIVDAVVTDGIKRSYTLTYQSPLNGAPSASRILSIRLIGEDVNSHFSNSKQTSITKLIVRPVSASINPPKPIGTVIHLPVSTAPNAANLDLTAIIKDARSLPVFDGFTIKYRLVTANGSPFDPVPINNPDSITDANGSVSTSINLGKLVSWYKVELYCVDTVGRQFVLGDTDDIHVGLLAPDSLWAPGGTATSVNLTWNDPNAAGEVQFYRLTMTPANGQPVVVDLPVANGTSVTIPGLTTKTTYTFNVQAHSIFNAIDILSNNSNTLTVTTP